MTGPQKAVAIINTLVCFIFIIIRNIIPTFVFDELTLILLGLGALPWLTLFFKKLKLPGIEAETHDVAQSTTSKPLPPPSKPQPTKPDEDLPPAAKKILATLWKYQKQHFRDDYSKRWTFTVQPNAQGYPYFLSGLAETVQRGLGVRSKNECVGRWNLQTKNI